MNGEVVSMQSFVSGDSAMGGIAYGGRASGGAA